jgi:thymidylate kinase
MAVDAILDNLEHEGTRVVFTHMPGGHPMEENHDETDMSNPEERTEVHIAKEILSATDMEKVKTLAKELLKMHGQE